MCLLALALCCSERFPFILLNNRDEFVSRATSNLFRDTRGILCKRDLGDSYSAAPTTCSSEGGDGNKKALGTWLGLQTENMVFAGLTNCRRCPCTMFNSDEEHVSRSLNPSDTSFSFAPTESRGLIVQNFLASNGHQRPSACRAQRSGVNTVLPSPPYYDGFNFFYGSLIDVCHNSLRFHSTDIGDEADIEGGQLGDGDQWVRKDFSKAGDSGIYYTSNRYAFPEDSPLHMGFHCCSNSFLNNPNEPKSIYLREKLQDVVERTPFFTTPSAAAAGSFGARDSGNYTTTGATCGSKSGSFNASPLAKISSVREAVDALAEPLCAQPNFRDFEPDFIEAARPCANPSAPFGEIIFKHEEALQANVYTHVEFSPKHIFKTRTQTVILAEKITRRGGNDGSVSRKEKEDDMKNGGMVFKLPTPDGGEAEFQVHYYTRETTSPTEHGPWVVGTA